MIRKLKNNEVNTIMDIWIDSTIKAHSFIDKEYWHNNYNTVKDIYIPMSESYVYEDDNEIKGFISIIDNEFIGALFVKVNSQKRGIGKELLEHAIKKYRKLSLAVYANNIGAVEFYKREGFNIVKEQDNEDSGYREYIMSI